MFCLATKNTSNQTQKLIGCTVTALRNMKFKVADFKTDDQIKNMFQSSSTTTNNIPNNSAPSNITIPHVPPTQQTPLLPSSILNGILMEKQKLESKINEFMDMLQNHNWDDFMKSEEKIGKMVTTATSKLQLACDIKYNDVKKLLSAKSDEEMELFRALLKSELHEKKREYRAWLAEENK